MADNAVLFPEAPVSWNVRYRSSQGFDCQLTLRGSDATEVLRLANDLMTRMVTIGIGGKKPQVEAPSESDPSWCPIHNCAMTAHQKDGQTWYSHKAPDATWCRGKRNGNGGGK
jgi:hypothetical protein